MKKSRKVKKINIKKGGNQDIKYYVISGPDTNRKEILLKEINKGGININNIIWIEGYNKNDIAENFRKVICTNDTLTPGQVSCVLKHYLALRNIVENNIPISVIMEDDIIFKDNVPNKLNTYLSQLPNDWDILFESDYLNYTDSNVKDDILVYKKDGSRGTIFYMITLKAAKLLYESFLPFNMTADFYYNELFKKYKINSYWTQPSNVEFRKNVNSLVN